MTTTTSMREFAAALDSGEANSEDAGDALRSAADEIDRLRSWLAEVGKVEAQAAALRAALVLAQRHGVVLPAGDVEEFADQQEAADTIARTLADTDAVAARYVDVTDPKLIDRVLLAVCNTADISDLWAFSRRAPDLLRDAVAHAIKAAR